MHSSLQEWQNAHKLKLQSPKSAWPTVLLFFIGLIIFAASSILAVRHVLPVSVAFIINVLMQFLMFTILHDASHRSLSQISWLNETLGTIAAFILTPIAGIRVFRFIHMQHHRFTNESIEKDPDYWAAQGSKWLLPLRWMFLDLHYIYWYLHHWNTRPRKEHLELIVIILTAVSVISVLTSYGFGFWVVFLWLISGRIASAALVMTFDFLPHYPHDVTAKENEYRATNLKPTLSWLMTPLLLSQNYHLIHHLYPRIPFYRYAWVWRNARNPLLLSGARLMRWNGKEIENGQYEHHPMDKSVNSTS